MSYCRKNKDVDLSLIHISIPISVPVEEPENRQGYSGGEYESHSSGMNLFAPEGSAVDAEEEAFIRAMQRKKKKKKRKGLGT